MSVTDRDRDLGPRSIFSTTAISFLALLTEFRRLSTECFTDFLTLVILPLLTLVELLRFLGVLVLFFEELFRYFYERFELLRLFLAGLLSFFVDDDTAGGVISSTHGFFGVKTLDARETLIDCS